MKKQEFKKGVDHRPPVFDIETSPAFTNYEVEPPNGFVVSSMAQPSLCPYHWKEPSARFDQITLMTTIAKAVDESPFLMLNRYAFSPTTSASGRPVFKLISRSACTRPSFFGGTKFANCSGTKLALSGAGLLSCGDGSVDSRVLMSLISDHSSKAGPMLRFSAVGVPPWAHLEKQSSGSSMGNDSQYTTMDYLSGALVSRVRNQRRISIRYLA